MPMELCAKCQINWTAWTFWNGYRRVPRCYECGKKFGRDRIRKGGDTDGTNPDFQQEGNSTSE